MLSSGYDIWLIVLRNSQQLHKIYYTRPIQNHSSQHPNIGGTGLPKSLHSWLSLAIQGFWLSQTILFYECGCWQVVCDPSG